MSSHSRSRSSNLLAGVAGVATVAAVASFTAVPTAQGVARVGSHPFHVVRMVSDQAGHAPVTDPSLVNAWGLALAPTSPLWVSNNGTDTSTLYAGATAPGSAPAKVPLTVSIPGGGAPTGVVFNPTTRFVLSTHGKTGPALFIFAGEHGSAHRLEQVRNTHRGGAGGAHQQHRLQGADDGVDEGQALPAGRQLRS